MNYAPEITEQLRISLGTFCRESGDIGQRETALVRLCEAAGFDGVTVAGVRAELLYLRDKGLLAPKDQLVSPEVRRWRITAAGRDWLAAL